MTDEKWLDVKEKGREKFTVLEEGTRELDSGPGSAEFLVFESPLGKVKLERVTRPVKLGERGIVSKRIGAHAVIEEQYSDTEVAKSFRVYRWDASGNAWLEMSVPWSFTF